MHDAATRTAVRTGYVRRRLPISESARQAGVSPATARGWKRAAAAEGDDWDRAKEASRLAEGGLGSISERILGDFSIMMTSTLEALGGDGADPIETSKAMATLSDAYVKVVRAVGRADPGQMRRMTLLEVAERLGHRLQDRPDLAAEMLPLIESTVAEMEAEQ